LSGRGFKNTVRLVLAALFSRNLLVNSLSSLNSWMVMAACLWRKDVLIYLHETDYILDQYRRAYPVRYALVAFIAARRRLLCTSELAREQYARRFNNRSATVVYECAGVEPETALGTAGTRIVMVGSINQRKGAELFSRVADMARHEGLDWSFHWIGAMGTRDEMSLSGNVVWHGWKWSPAPIVEQCDVFLLSSVDDPFPLSVLEAMGMGKRIVAFDRTGIAEVIDGCPGCAVYREYTAEAVMECIRKVMLASDTAVCEQVPRLAELYGSAKRFSDRLDPLLK
jgi:glycosyltransferase involved in cell wall biosynthesis